MLCEILRSDGSTPRGAGAKMAVFDDGTTLGTVGGGALERLAGARAAELLRESRSETKEYRLSPNKEEDIGMVCGGDVLMGFYCCDPARAEDMAAFDALRDILGNNGTAWIKTEFDASGGARLSVIEREDIHSESERLPTEPKLTRTERQTVLLEPAARHETVYIFGGGHVGAALAPALSAVGFHVVVYDTRPDFVTKERFPTAKQLLFGSFENVLDTVRITPEDYVVIMTPGHKADHMVLSQALRTEATYIGCIGSSKKVAYINQRLAEEGFSEEDIARIHSPIGLPIRAQTPEEIAVSITAELILHRHTFGRASE
ncbi:MAG: XdhC family protein [Oscillospiraceae bacterium]|nr:XdhC family protein [Oscillospiraceae bacterium]